MQYSWPSHGKNAAILLSGFVTMFFTVTTKYMNLCFLYTVFFFKLYALEEGRTSTIRKNSLPPLHSLMIWAGKQKVILLWYIIIYGNLYKLSPAYKIIAYKTESYKKINYSINTDDTLFFYSVLVKKWLYNVTEILTKYYIRDLDP